MVSLHTKISYVKSAIRITGYTALFGVSKHPFIWLAAILLIAAETLGIAEEATL